MLRSTRTASQIARAILLATAVEASASPTIFTPALGDAGLRGTPYGWIGPLGTPVWEEYRKGWDDHVPPFPEAYVVDAGTDGYVLYDQLRQGWGYPDGGPQTYHAPGTFFGAVHRLSSPRSAHLSFVSSSGPGIDARVCFMEDEAADGGAPLSAFVALAGGDDGREMDPWYGPWGVDGVCLHTLFMPTGAHWQMTPQEATFGAATSSLQEFQRTNYLASVGFPNMTALGGGIYDMGLASSSPIPVNWSLQQLDAGLTFTVDFGGPRMTWVIDDGKTIFGLTNPGNPDDAGYQGGSLDLPALVPVFYTGTVFQTPMDPLPDANEIFGVVGTAPVITGLSASVGPGVATILIVTATNTSGVTDTQYLATVNFRSSDPLAMLPGPYTFDAGDMGIHVFDVSFGTPGQQSVTVYDQDTPAMASTQQITVTGPDSGVQGGDAGASDAGGADGGSAASFGISCGCGAVDGVPTGLLALALLFIARRLRPERTASR